MKMRTGFLICAALILGAIYAHFFTDLFGPKKIHILFTNRNSKIFFGLDNKEYNITSVKVFRAAEIATNKYAHPLWNLTTDSNSAPTTDFLYGSPIAGMKPAVAKVEPEPLEPNVNYRIVVEAGKIKGEKDFKVR
ncbi:MAG: hypothetical protein M3Y82_01485 [Verrucomicrobiota bacterium]|nr:hypothetical protein [Verrucomicrobiota bacterium]